MPAGLQPRGEAFVGDGGGVDNRGPKLYIHMEFAAKKQIGEYP